MFVQERFLRVTHFQFYQGNVEQISFHEQDLKAM